MVEAKEFLLRKIPKAFESCWGASARSRRKVANERVVQGKT